MQFLKIDLVVTYDEYGNAVAMSNNDAVESAEIYERVHNEVELNFVRQCKIILKVPAILIPEVEVQVSDENVTKIEAEG